MGKKVSIDSLVDAVMEELTEYNKLAEETMKKAVTKAGQTVRKEIQAGAPVQTGRYSRQEERRPDQGFPAYRSCRRTRREAAGG